MFNRITIIGLGLIGGSLGLAIKKKRLAKEVVGVSRRRSTIRKAKSLGVIDRVTLDVKKGVRDADLVILAAPVLKIIDIATQISPFLEKGAIVTDAGSTKKDIVKNIEKALPRNVHFVGSHPLAGSEHSGVSYADKDLFKGAHCILTKSNHTNVTALSKMKKFWKNLGMEVEIMSPETHDKILSKISHLPHAAAVSLCNVCGKQDLDLVAGGFKDTTRIASSSPELWKDIFVTNRENIARDIVIFRKELLKIEKALKSSKEKELIKLFRKAKSIRDCIKPQTSNIKIQNKSQIQNSK